MHLLLLSSRHDFCLATLSVSRLSTNLPCFLASSAPPSPLKRVAHPTTHSLEILPRRPSPAGTYSKRSHPIDSPILRSTDSFRLKISAFDDTFHIHLRPNEHLIHPAARINYYTVTPDGRSVLSHTEPLLPESVKAYWGEVVHPLASEGRMREDAAGVWPRPSGKSELGWARITVHHQGDTSKGVAPVFEGAFSVNGKVHHVMTKDNYLRNKHHLDPHLTILDYGHPDSALVIFRDQDLMTHEEHRAATGGKEPYPAAHTCAHDSLSHNVDPYENPVLRKPTPQTTPWYNPFGIYGNSSLSKRDDVAGGGMSTKFV